jgi:hypothetical protein
VAGGFRHGDQRRVGRDLEILEGVVREGVLQDLVGHRDMGDRGQVAHELGHGVLQERAVLAEGMQDLVDAADLLLGLDDVLAQELLHLGIALEPLDLAVHDLERLLLEGMGVDEPGDEDRMGGLGPGEIRHRIGHGLLLSKVDAGERRVNKAGRRLVPRRRRSPFPACRLPLPAGGGGNPFTGRGSRPQPRPGNDFSGVVGVFVYGARTFRRVVGPRNASDDPTALDDIPARPPRTNRPSPARPGGPPLSKNQKGRTDVDYG